MWRMHEGKWSLTLTTWFDCFVNAVRYSEWYPGNSLFFCIYTLCNSLFFIIIQTTKSSWNVLFQNECSTTFFYNISGGNVKVAQTCHLFSVHSTSDSITVVDDSTYAYLLNTLYRMHLLHLCLVFNLVFCFGPIRLISEVGLDLEWMQILLELVCYCNISL